MKALSYIACITVLLTTFNSQAESASHHSGQASKHSALAVSHGTVGSAQVASAAAAVPLVVIGSVAVSTGAASVELGKGMSKLANNKKTNVVHHQPVVLEVTEITVTVDPSPAEAMKDN